MARVIKKMMLVLVCMPLMVYSQYAEFDTRKSAEKGIEFIKELNWVDVQKKAKDENKYIFLDCYATWCVPCKAMERDIFSLQEVGSFFNGKFISVKLQIDTSKRDDAYTRSWYKDAQDIIKKYQISAVPGYLFFAPDGELVHRDVGYKNQSDFMALAGNAIDPNRQYYTLIKKYKDGSLANDRKGYLARIAYNSGDVKLAEAIANDYINNYLLKLPARLIYTKESLDFLSIFTHNSNDKSFKLFYENPKKIDSVMGQEWYAHKVVFPIILNEEINPLLSKSAESNTKDINWTKINNKIAQKFGNDYAEQAVLSAKEKWFQFKGNWEELFKVYVARYEKYGIDVEPNGNFSASGLGVNNNMAWEIFLHSEKGDFLDKAIEWMGLMLKRIPQESPYYEWSMDTYANLLYKCGRQSEAIKFQSKSLEISMSKNKSGQSASIKDALDKMKAGIPTWPQE